MSGRAMVRTDGRTVNDDQDYTGSLTGAPAQETGQSPVPEEEAARSEEEAAGDLFGMSAEPEPPPVNGLGVADWLVEPLVAAAIEGLESMSRTDVPPRLVPLVGRRHPKLSRANRDLIAASIGQHHKFTQAVYDRLFTGLESKSTLVANRDAKAVIALIETGEIDAPDAVCLLFADERPGDAEAVAEWATTKAPGSDTLSGIIGAL
ncbi:MAG TPA: hypothetical protein VKY26_11040, partial [Actinomycetota bacterium]|nr:hypothetical protein [Actinomycetota bacterium]